MVMAHLINYKYITLVVPELEVNDLYKESINKFVKDTLQQSNVIKINNFRKRYHSYAQAIKNQDSREEESKNEKKTVKLANEQNK